jgi:hypothetical protein
MLPGHRAQQFVMQVGKPNSLVTAASGTLAHPKRHTYL